MICFQKQQVDDSFDGITIISVFNSKNRFY